MAEDKYHPIPGVMDTIDCLRKENQDLRKQVAELTSANIEAISYMEQLCLALNEHLGFRYYSGGVGNFLELIKKSQDFISKHAVEEKCK